MPRSLVAADRTNRHHYTFQPLAVYSLYHKTSRCVLILTIKQFHSVATHNHQHPVWLHLSVFPRSSSGQHFPVEDTTGVQYTLLDSILFTGCVCVCVCVCVCKNNYKNIFNIIEYNESTFLIDSEHLYTVLGTLQPVLQYFNSK